MAFANTLLPVPLSPYQLSGWPQLGSRLWILGAGLLAWARQALGLNDVFPET
jgi:hypothetical protein